MQGHAIKISYDFPLCSATLFVAEEPASHCEKGTIFVDGFRTWVDQMCTKYNWLVVSIIFCFPSYLTWLSKLTNSQMNIKHGLKMSFLNVLVLAQESSLYQRIVRSLSVFVEFQNFKLVDFRPPPLHQVFLEKLLVATLPNFGKGWSGWGLFLL